MIDDKIVLLREHSALHSPDRDGLQLAINKAEFIEQAICPAIEARSGTSYTLSIEKQRGRNSGQYLGG